MKLLIIYSTKFGYKTSVKNLDDIKTIDKEEVFENILTAFIHVEESDMENAGKSETKMIKNIKWAAKKNETNRILLHSFAHLSESKASPEFTKTLFDSAMNRLTASGYEVFQTPFGYFLDLDLKAPGISSARIFKSF
jgi:hypothetical protein